MTLPQVDSLRRAASLAVVLLVSLAAPAHAAVTMVTASLKVRAQVEGTGIRLNWAPASSTVAVTSYEVRRKTLGDSTWTTVLVDAATGSKATTYLDTTAQAGVLYEYRVVLDSTNADYDNANGIVAAGVAVEPLHARGRVVLVVEDAVATGLATEVERFQRDLIGDGWRVTTLTAPRHVSYPTAANSLTEATNPAAVLKQRIREVYNGDPANTKAVILLGRVQVPYSGNTGYDGHGSRAFPTDVYYGNMNDTWSDATINSTTWDGLTNNSTATPTAGSRNDNVPGDGKFDRNTVTANQLYVGRIDTSSMDIFGNETALLRQYLEKNYRWRRGQIPNEPRVAFFEQHDASTTSHANPTLRRALPALYSDAQMQSNTATLRGPDASYLIDLETTPHQWVSVGSAGSSTSINGMAVQNMAFLQSMGVIYGLYGSYMGDWDQANNLLRGVTAQRHYGLISYLGGPPAWQVAPMAMGRPFGEAQIVRLNASVSNPYRDTAITNVRFGAIWHNILGDPTLTLTAVPPPRAPQFAGGTFSWQPPSAPVDGYYVYSAPTIDAAFTLRTPQPITATTFAVPAEDPAGTIYMVRAVRLVAPFSGSYHALSQGVFSDRNINGPPMVWAAASQQAYETLTVPVQASMSDDGFPSGTLTGTWSMDEGPGTVTFGNAASPQTTATVSVPGRYRLRFTATDGTLSDSDVTTVVVSADVLAATDDTYADQPSPTAARGGAFANELRAGLLTGGQRRTIYLKFDLGASYRRPTQATLRLRTYSSNVAGGVWAVHPVSDTTWTEGALTWNNAPAYEAAPIAQSPAIPANRFSTWVDIDLGSFLNLRTGRVAFALVSDSAGLSAFSRYANAGVDAPHLVLRYDAANAAQGLYASEEFNLPDGATTNAGSLGWTANASAAQPGFTFAVKGREFVAQYTRGEVVWRSETLPLNPQKSYVAAVRWREFGTLEASDYVRAYYRLDGGPETLFADRTDDFTGPVTDGTPPLQGRTVQIVIRQFTDASDEGHAWNAVRLFSLDGQLGPASYGQWARANGLPIDGSANGGFRAAPAGDGVPNLLKFALGLPPAHFGLGGRVGTPRVWSAGAGQPEYAAIPVTIPEPVPPEIIYRPRASSDLADWSASLVEVSRTPNGDGTTTVLYRDPQPLGSGRRFLKVDVETP